MFAANSVKMVKFVTLIILSISFQIFGNVETFTQNSDKNVWKVLLNRFMGLAWENHDHHDSTSKMLEDLYHGGLDVYLKCSIDKSETQHDIKESNFICGSFHIISDQIGSNDEPQLTIYPLKQFDVNVTFHIFMLHTVRGENFNK